MTLAAKYGWPLFTVLPDELPPLFSHLEMELWALYATELKDHGNDI